MYFKSWIDLVKRLNWPVGEYKTLTRVADFTYMVGPPLNHHFPWAHIELHMVNYIYPSVEKASIIAYSSYAYVIYVFDDARLTFDRYVPVAVWFRSDMFRGQYA